MNILRYSLLLVLLLPMTVVSETIEIQRDDYLKFIVGNYVFGFNEFDTSVIADESTVSVGIYYDFSTQSAQRAESLAERIRSQVPAILAGYDWAEDINVTVNVYSEDRTGRGY